MLIFHATFDAWRHHTDLPKSKLNTELYIFCCTGRQKRTKLYGFVPTYSKVFRG